MSNHYKVQTRYEFVEKCPYCGSTVELQRSNYVYRCNKDYGNLWVCSKFPKCDSYVGCHRGTTVPLGRLANSELRKVRNLAHQEFDKIWESGKMKRSKAYEWLAVTLNIPLEECHIGMFDVDMCNRVVEVCRKYYTRNEGKPKYMRGIKDNNPVDI